MMNTFLKIAALFLYSTITLAQNDAFLSNTAMSYFTKGDWAIFNQAQNRVLNNANNGVKVTWNNPQTGAHGYMVASATPSQNGMRCRVISFYNTANLINGEGTYRFCKSGNQWKIY